MLLSYKNNMFIYLSLQVQLFIQKHLSTKRKWIFNNLEY